MHKDLEHYCINICFIKILGFVLQGYMIYIRNTPEMNISKEDVDLLFGNIDAIYNFNQSVLHLNDCLGGGGGNLVS